MKRIRNIGLIGVISLMMAGCGVAGDPGHCYFSIDWERYGSDYGVYYYEDSNPDVPDSEDIIAQRYYDCYPGIYDYYYESEDPDYIYTYTGTYELIQNPGTPGGLFTDGMDGADTYFDLYLYVYQEVGSALAGAEGDSSPDITKTLGKDEFFKNRIDETFDNNTGSAIHRTVERERSYAQNGWSFHVKEQVNIFRKKEQ